VLKKKDNRDDEIIKYIGLQLRKRTFTNERFLDKKLMLYTLLNQIEKGEINLSQANYWIIYCNLTKIDY
jgi:hypothetical protein